MISVGSRRRYVRSDAICQITTSSWSRRTCQIASRATRVTTHHNDLHVVVVGQLKGGLCPIANAASVASEVAETVIPPGGEFTMIAYTPTSPLSGEPRFREVTFELDRCRLRPSSKVFESPKVAAEYFSPPSISRRLRR